MNTPSPPTTSPPLEPSSYSGQLHADLWRELVAIALGIFLVDLVLRRVRVFDRKFGRR